MKELRSSRYETSVNHMIETYMTIEQQWGCISLTTIEHMLIFCTGMIQIQEMLPYFHN